MSIPVTSSCVDTRFLAGMYPEVELLGHRQLCVSSVEEAQACLPLQLHRFAFPPVVHEGSDLFLHVLHKTFFFLTSVTFSACEVASFFWLCWVFSGCGGQGLLFAGCELLTAVASLVSEHRLWSVGPSLWRMDLVAPRHVASSQIRDRTRVPCVVRVIRNHWTSREVRSGFLL